MLRFDLPVLSRDDPSNLCRIPDANRIIGVDVSLPAGEHAEAW